MTPQDTMNAKSDALKRSVNAIDPFTLQEYANGASKMVNNNDIDNILRGKLDGRTNRDEELRNRLIIDILSEHAADDTALDAARRQWNDRVEGATHNDLLYTTPEEEKRNDELIRALAERNTANQGLTTDEKQALLAALIRKESWDTWHTAQEKERTRTQGPETEEIEGGATAARVSIRGTGPGAAVETSGAERLREAAVALPLDKDASELTGGGRISDDAAEALSHELPELQAILLELTEELETSVDEAQTRQTWEKVRNAVNRIPAETIKANHELNHLVMLADRDGQAIGANLGRRADTARSRSRSQDDPRELDIPSLAIQSFGMSLN